MTTAETPEYSPTWLRLRESADAAARAADLLDALPPRPAGDTPRVIHDLGCGTGSMGRWLAPRLPGPQHWIMYDRDSVLLKHAADTMTDAAADGAPVTVETRQADITRLTAADLAGADLVTASALLDLLTADELASLAEACVTAGCPALFTLSVSGRVELSPADPLDEEIVAAFNAHQRRRTGGRLLLGPDATAAAAAAFTRLGATVLTRPSPWVLDADQSDLAAEWLTGWVGAATVHSAKVEKQVTAYLRRRLAEAATGRLRVVVHHEDLLGRSS